jgi:hypothetical protein
VLSGRNPSYDVRTLKPYQKRTLFALALAFCLTFPFTVAELTKIVPPPMPDFRVYLTAAELVREHKNVDIYDGANLGIDPQGQPAPIGSEFYKVALTKGMPAPGVYVYLPTLADALLPLTPLPLRAALHAWLLIDVLAMLAIAALLSWMVRRPLLGRLTLLIFLALLAFRPDTSAIFWGQISIILLLLWVAGTACFARQHIALSAIFFALGTAVKLTPVIVILPMLFWKQWRWTAWFLASLAGILVLLCWINGPATVAEYLFHVMPPMSSSVAGVMNATFASGVKMLYAAAHPGGFQMLSGGFQKHVTVPPSVTLAGRGVSMLAFLAAMTAIYRGRRLAGKLDRAKMLSLVAVLSLIVSPVSWRAAYTFAFPILFLLWMEAFQEEIPRWRLALLAACTMEFAFLFDSLLGKITHGPIFAAAALFAPCAGLLLIFATMNAIHSRRELPIEAAAYP